MNDMSHFTLEHLDNLSKLSQISLHEEERKSLLIELEQFLSHIEKIEQVECDIAPLHSLVEQTIEILREDIPSNPNDETLWNKDAFLLNCPSHSASMIQVPKVL